MKKPRSMAHPSPAEAPLEPAGSLLAASFFESLPWPAWFGILNVTPDSFSDGGFYFPQGSASVSRAQALVAAGAHVIDVGGVSTRPGSKDIPHAQEWARVRPVLEALRAALPGVLLSLDTSSPSTLARAAEAGLVDVANDVWAGRKREDGRTTFEVCAEHALPLIVMHMRGEPSTMQLGAQSLASEPQTASESWYTDCVAEVCAFLSERAAAARSQGVQSIAIDPGIGFGKQLSDNLALLSRDGMEALVALGYPVLIGLSRKRFLAELEATRPSPRVQIAAEATARDAVSKAWEARSVAFGARIVRSHRAPGEVAPDPEAFDTEKGHL